MSPDISIVICTRDRAESLARVLERHARLETDPGWELVVVNDGSRDDTAAMLSRAASTAPLAGRLRVVTTPGVGLGAARNAGWQAATGELVLFTDDDCYPADDLLDRLRECFADPAVSFIGGRLLPYTPEDAAIAVVTRTERVEIAGPGFVPAGLLPGANLTVRRSALERVGGFDPEFGAGTRFPAEDVELVARLAGAGLRGGYDPRPVVHHHHGRVSEDAQRSLRIEYDRGRGAYYAKCLSNPVLRPHYLRAIARRLLKGSWRRGGRELAGAIGDWTRS